MAANNQEALGQFFNDSLLGEDSDDDIDKIKWATAFNKLSINMTKKDVIKIFDYIDSEKLGYIDRFDFMEFCNKQHFNDSTIKHLKDILISRIEAFLRMSCIGDESIEIIYSKHTINPCKSTNTKSHDPYYNYYYDDDVFHEFDPQEFAMLEIKNCLCCSHCGRQSNTFILWKKHESKCKYDAEKYIAYLISAIDQDEDISFLDDNKVIESVIESVIEHKNNNNGVPPPPPLPPPPPPLNEYVIRYNDNEMGEIMMQIPDKIPIWSRLFVSTNKDTLTGKRLESLENNKYSYIKCTKSSAYKDYRDILQNKMFDLLSVPKRINGKIARFKITSIANSDNNLNSIYSISSPNQVNNYIVERKSSEPIHKFVKFKLQNSTTELTNTDDYKSSIPKYVGDLEESDVDDYDTTRISDTIDDTDYHNLNKILSISQPVSDNDNDNNFNNFNKQYSNAGSQGAPRSKSSFNLTITQPQPIINVINSNNKLNIPISSISQNTNIDQDQQTVGQQTVETADSEEVSSADSLSSMTAEEENKQNNMIKTITTSGYHASIDMGSIDMSNHFEVRNGSMSLNPLNERIASPISSPNTPLTLDNNSRDTHTHTHTFMHLNLNDVLNDDNSNTYPYYENIIDLILEFSHVNNPLYVDGYLMLHEMVFDIYNNYYNKIWYKYRLNLWLLLLFDQHRINELEKHYKINKTTNNYENGKLKWIYNLHDMIYYDQSLFTHLLHTYGIPPSLKSLIWFHISHNHHIITDLDIFLYNTDIESLNIIDMPLVDNVLNNIFNKIYNTDIVQSVLMKSYVFQPFKHHNSHSYHIRRIINGKNKKKLLPNLYNPQNRYIFYYDILYILLQHIWSKLPNECQQIIYQFWTQMQIQTNGNNQWLFGNINVINKLFLNSNNINDIEFIMSIYLWDGMTGIGILLTSIILIAIHSKKSINYFYKNPLIQSQTHKIPKVYKSVYDYIVHKSDYDNVSISEIVIKKLLHII